MKDERGFILILTFVFMAALTIAVGGMLYMTGFSTRNIGAVIDDYKMLDLADAGVEKAYRALLDDYDTTTQTGSADLRGADTSLSNSVGSPDNMRYITTSGSSYATINANTDYAILRVFDSNYTNTKIISVEIHAIAVRSGGSGSNNMVVSYTTDGSSYTTVINQAIPSSIQDLSASVMGLTWADIMSPNFRLRTVRTGTGSRSIRLYSMYLRITYGIDTLKESWATGDYAAFPISLSNGTIQSIAITDEASKVHLNYASQSLLTNLFTNLGIASASTKAANVVNYRGASLTNPFDSVEELQQVTGITAADYAAIKDYVTVYSFVNSNVYRPAGPRAPININTASFNVLKSVFDSLGLGSGDSTSLANDIVTFRNAAPFTCFYTSNAAISTDFYDFVNGRAYLTASERNIVLDNCDASSLIPVSGYAGYNCTTTELSYAGSVFYINALAQVGARKLRVKTLAGNDGSRTFSTYTTEPVAAYSGWRKENFE